MNFSARCPNFSFNFQSYICIAKKLKIFQIQIYNKCMIMFIMVVVNIWRYLLYFSTINRCISNIKWKTSMIDSIMIVKNIWRSLSYSSSISINIFKWRYSMIGFIMVVINIWKSLLYFSSINKSIPNNKCVNMEIKRSPTWNLYESM